MVLLDVDEARGRPGSEKLGAQKPKVVQKPHAARPVQAVPKRAEPRPIIVNRKPERERQEAFIDAALANKPAQVRGSNAERPPSTKRINAVQDRHHAEWGEFCAATERARDRHAADMCREYGGREEQLRKDIAQREETAQAKGVGRFWLKVTGQLDREAEALDGLRRSLQNLEWRKSEATETFENRLTQERDALRDRHALEWQAVNPQSADPQHAVNPVSELLMQERQAVEQAEIAKDLEPTGTEIEF